MDVFQKDFRFVPVAENFGSVVLVKTDKGQQTSSMVVHIFGCWPILAIIMLMTSVMGIFVWIAVSAINFCLHLLAGRLTKRLASYTE